MKDTARGWALALAAAAVVLIIIANMVRPGPGMEGSWPWAGGLMAFPIGAAIVLLRAPGNTIGRLLAFVALAAGTDFALSWLAVTYADRVVAAYLEALTTPATVGIFAGILAVLHLFPNGRPLNGWHRRVVVALGVWFTGSALLGLIGPGPVGFSQTPNPLGFGPQWTRDALDALLLGVPLFAAAGVVVLFLRRREATPVERAQLRWFFAGGTALAVTLAVALNSGESESRLVEIVASVLVMLAFWSLPAAIVIAIVRYHLYDIDRLVSRTVTYLVIAGVLAAVYGASVVLLQSFLPAGASSLAVAASTLAAAGLFSPVRGQVQQRLERRFNRARYEAGAVTHEFVRRLQQQIDLEAIESDLLIAVARTLQPGSVRMWLRPAAGRSTNRRVGP